MKREVPVSTYGQWYRINAGFQEVLRGLRALRREPGFSAAQLRGFEQLSREARAATNSYVAEVVEARETEEAGRLFRRRQARQRREDQAE
jgi:hypothetical protein